MPQMIGILLLAGSIAALGVPAKPAEARATTDFAETGHVDDWLRHPVYGDPSFDAFERVPGNPMHRGSPPLEWPVNGFLFLDPRSGRHYAYVGEYTLGYASRPSRCLLYRSDDRAHSWTRIGVVLQGDPASFDKGGHTPDVSVVYDSGRYHMVYDWGELDFNAEGGLAYAWAEHPEGPWHRAAEPITRNTRLTPMLGRYRRTYAATLIRRSNDWMVVGMMDAAPNSWALFAITAPRPEGPWSERKLLRHVERDEFHPPLMEFYPAFAHDGFLYVPSTSVALNRNFNLLLRAPLEQATDPAAMTIVRHGSLWHSEDVEHESYGLWGQTFSGAINPDGTLLALFHSRDSRGMGTANLARRAWDRPLRERGFVLSGHQGPSMTLLRRAFREFSLETRFGLRGTASLIWDYRGQLSPNAPQSDATLHHLARTRFRAVQCTSNTWQVVRVNGAGETVVLASGSMPADSRRRLRLEQQAEGRVQLSIGRGTVWEGRFETEDKARETGENSGVLGWWVEPHSHLEVQSFVAEGESRPASFTYLGGEALLGAGQNPAGWEERHSPEFRHGHGWVSKAAGEKAKWNITGNRLTLWSPRGPEFGEAEIRLDGRVVAVVDLRAERPVTSSRVWSGEATSGLFHALVWQARTGRLPVDALEVE